MVRAIERERETEKIFVCKCVLYDNGGRRGEEMGRLYDDIQQQRRGACEREVRREGNLTNKAREELGGPREKIEQGLNEAQKLEHVVFYIVHAPPQS